MSPDPARWARIQDLFHRAADLSPDGQRALLDAERGDDAALRIEVESLLAGDRVSVGIVAGACVIVLAPILTAIYVRWANQHYDAAVRRLRGGKA
ncbi:MAG TPA: DUF485 domain-containing protein [Kofleriaceae bacterium]|nr:DUF485 domain-containing protein [Kofleriaceae bacterium]